MKRINLWHIIAVMVILASVCVYTAICSAGSESTGPARASGTNYGKIDWSTVPLSTNPVVVVDSKFVANETGYTVTNTRVETRTQVDIEFIQTKE